MHHHHRHEGGETAQNHILVAFWLNLLFSLAEMIGGAVTGSVAILSDAVHDMGDAVSVGLSYFLEKKSTRPPDDRFPYGYRRYSVVGGLVTTLVLLVGSALVLYNAVCRFAAPTSIHYDGMILLAVVGMLVNGLAAFFTHHGESVNERAVNLHMLEDVLGWAMVLVGAVVMRLTDWWWIDPLMSVCVTVFILASALQNLKTVLDIFLEKTPDGVDLAAARARVLALDGVEELSAFRVWTLDGTHHLATLCVRINGDPTAVKATLQDALAAFGIAHATIETET